MAEKVRRFLEALASATEHISSSEYVTLLVTEKSFEKLKAACRYYDEQRFR